MDKLYSLKEAARILKANPWRVTYLLASGKVPEPKLRLAGRRVFNVEDLERLAELLGTPIIDSKEGEQE